MPPTGGGGGFSGVTTNSTLTGSGLASSALSVNGWPTNIFIIGGQADSSNATVANKVNYSGFYLTTSLTFTTLGVDISTPDGVNNSDIGIYNAAGSSLLANIGAQHLGSGGLQSFTITQGTVTLQPARYLLAFTSAAGTLTLNKDNRVITWAFTSGGVGVSAGGALPASIPAPTVSFTISGGFLAYLFA